MTAAPFNGHREPNFIPRTITPEMEQAALRAIAAKEIGCRASALAYALGMRHAATQELIDHLHGRGLILNRAETGRPLWVTAEIDPQHVREDLKPKLLRRLAGRCELPGTLARELRAEVEDVRETCRALAQDGLLYCRVVGATFVFRGESWLEESALARPVPASPLAAFRAQTRPETPTPRPKATGIQERVLAILTETPDLTTEEILARLPDAPGSLSPTLGRLKKSGAICISGQVRRKNKSYVSFFPTYCTARQMAQRKAAGTAEQFNRLDKRRRPEIGREIRQKVLELLTRQATVDAPALAELLGEDRRMVSGVLLAMAREGVLVLSGTRPSPSGRAKNINLYSLAHRTQEAAD